jgi:hypothetical protein
LDRAFSIFLGKLKYKHAPSQALTNSISEAVTGKRKRAKTSPSSPCQSVVPSVELTRAFGIYFGKIEFI